MISERININCFKSMAKTYEKKHAMIVEGCRLFFNINVKFQRLRGRHFPGLLYP